MGMLHQPRARVCVGTFSVAHSGSRLTCPAHASEPRGVVCHEVHTATLMMQFRSFETRVGHGDAAFQHVPVRSDGQGDAVCIWASHLHADTRAIRHTEVVQISRVQAQGGICRLSVVDAYDELASAHLLRRKVKGWEALAPTV